MQDNESETPSEETAGMGLRRRSVLKQVGALGAAGVVGTTAGTDPAAAAHCFGPDDDLYLQEESESNETTEFEAEDGTSPCGELRLASSTDVGHMETIQDDGGGATHIFYFATDAATEWMTTNEEAYTIWYHEVDLDSADITGSILDFCQPRTGSYPASSSDKVDKVWETLAGIALEKIADAISFPLGVLETAEALADALTYTETGDTRQIFEHERGGLEVESKTKVQGTFEVNVPDGSAGYAEMVSTTRAAGDVDPNRGACFGPHITHDETFFLYCDYDSANVFTYDPRISP